MSFVLTYNEGYLVFVVQYKKGNVNIRGNYNVVSKNITLDEFNFEFPIVGNTIIDDSKIDLMEAAIVIDDMVVVIMNSGFSFYMKLHSDNTAYYNLYFLDVGVQSAYWCANMTCYSFGGLDKDILTNALGRVDYYNSSIFEYTPLVKMRRVPPLRMNIHMKRIQTDMYIFGGKNGNKYYNDLWKYSIKKDLWSSVVSTGHRPTPRGSYSGDSQGDILVIWGGEDESGYLNDLFIYNSYSEVWTEYLIPSLSQPSKRKDACIVFDLPFAYIYGGVDSSGPLSDLWRFNFGNNTYIKIIDSKPMSKPTCKIIKGNIIFITNENWYIKYGIPDNSLEITSISMHAGSTILITDEYYIFFGGRTKNYGKAYNTIKALGFSQDNEAYLDEYFYDAAHEYYNRSVYIYGGGYMISEYALFPYMLMPRFMRINMDEVCEVKTCKALCSAGFKTTNNGHCTLCSEGTFSPNIGSSMCYNCDAGFYNLYQGSTSGTQCYPCPEGTFGEKKAAKLCKICPPDTYCPVRSVYPVQGSLGVRQKPTSQPGLYKPEYPGKVFGIFFKLVFGITVLAVALGLSFKVLRNYLKQLDLFSTKHCYEEGEYVKITKNLIGGFFSLIFFSSVIIIVGYFISIFLYENLEEKKFLLPAEVISNEVSSFKTDFEVEIRLKDYGGSCGAGIHIIGYYNPYNCGKYISIIPNGIVRDSEIIICEDLQNGFCSVKYLCNNCEILSNAYIDLTLSESHTFSTGISVNITSDSSIPKFRSSSFSEVSASKNHFIIGPMFTEFYFTAIRSYFSISEANSAFTQTGYHVTTNKNPVLGSQFSIENLGANMQINVRMFLDKHKDVLCTFRLQKNIPFIVACILTGALGGIFTFIGVVMNLFEAHSKKKASSPSSPIDFNIIRYRNLGISEMNFNWNSERIIESDEPPRASLPNISELSNFRDYSESRSILINNLVNSR